MDGWSSGIEILPDIDLSNDWAFDGKSVVGKVETRKTKRLSIHDVIKSFNNAEEEKEPIPEVPIPSVFGKGFAEVAPPKNAHKLSLNNSRPLCYDPTKPCILTMPSKSFESRKTETKKPVKKVKSRIPKGYGKHRFINSNVNPLEKKGALEEKYVASNFMKNQDYGTCSDSIGRFNAR